MQHQIVDTEKKDQNDLGLYHWVANYTDVNIEPSVNVYHWVYGAKGSDHDDEEVDKTALQGFSLYLSKKWTENVIRKRIREHIINIHHFIDKTICIAMYDGNILDIENVMILNCRLHDRKSNALLYLVAEKQCNHKYVMRQHLYTKNELCRGYKLNGNELPIPWHDCKHNQETLTHFNANMDAMLNHPAAFCQHVVFKTKWHKLPIFGAVDNNNTSNTQLTLSITKTQFIRMIEHYVHNDKNKKEWIPLVMFHDDGYRVEYIHMIKIRNNIDIAISYVYNHNKNRIKATGIHLHKQYMLRQHQLISPNHDCHCLDDFQTEIDILRIGNQCDTDHDTDTDTNQVHVQLQDLTKTNVVLEQENKLIKEQIHELRKSSHSVKPNTIMLPMNPIDPQSMTSMSTPVSPEFTTSGITTQSLSLSVTTSTCPSSPIKPSTSQLTPIHSNETDVNINKPFELIVSEDESEEPLEPEPKVPTYNSLEDLYRYFIKTSATQDMDDVMTVYGGDTANNTSAKPYRASKSNEGNDKSRNNYNDSDESGSNGNDCNDGSGDRSNEDHDDKKKDKNNNNNEIDQDDEDDDDDEAETDRLIKVFMDLEDIDDESLPRILAPFSQKTMDKVFVGIQKLVAAKMRIQNALKQSDEDHKSYDRDFKSNISVSNSKSTTTQSNNRGSYIPDHIRPIYQLQREFTNKIIPETVAEPINIRKGAVYEFMLKMLSINIHWKNYVENDNKRIFNLGLHQKKTNEDLYFIAERINAPRKHHKWCIDKLCIKHDIICNGTLPDPMEIQDETKEVKELLMKSQDEIIQNTNWNKIYIHNERNNKRRMTLSITKLTFTNCLKQFVDRECEIVIIPILMFGAKDKYWREYIWIVSVYDNVDIGVSFKYNKLQKKLNVIGIHLDKELIFKQQQIISPSLCYSDFTKFNSQITYLHIGNPDDDVNRIKALKKELHTYHHRLLSSSSSSNAMNELNRGCCTPSSICSSITTTPNHSRSNLMLSNSNDSLTTSNHQ